MSGSGPPLARLFCRRPALSRLRSSEEIEILRIAAFQEGAAARPFVVVPERAGRLNGNYGPR